MTFCQFFMFQDFSRTIFQDFQVFQSLWKPDTYIHIYILAARKRLPVYIFVQGATKDQNGTMYEIGLRLLFMSHHGRLSVTFPVPLTLAITPAVICVQGPRGSPRFFYV